MGCFYETIPARGRAVWAGTKIVILSQELNRIGEIRKFPGQKYLLQRYLLSRERTIKNQLDWLNTFGEK